MKVVALAGGVGGAKLADGLAQALPPQDLTIIVNTGDDFEHLGLKICPDLDTVCYTLAGLANPSSGWGREGETWNALESLVALGGPGWFRIGDKDLGTHLERTRLLGKGIKLSEITRRFCRAWGVAVNVLPMSEDPVPTYVITEEGEMPFQEYFVRRQCQPRVTGFRFEGVEEARAAEGCMEAIREADLAIICPSNPRVSIDPILTIAGMRPALRDRPAVAVSPLIGGKAVKGPAAKMFSELGIPPSALAVAKHYGAVSDGGLLAGFMLDDSDGNQAEAIEAMGIDAKTTDILMNSRREREVLARKVLEFAEQM